MQCDYIPRKAGESAHLPTWVVIHATAPDMEPIVNIRTKFESYRLGSDDIDEQHRTLFDYIENLDVAIANGDRWLVVYQTPAELGH